MTNIRRGLQRRARPLATARILGHRSNSLRVRPVGSTQRLFKSWQRPRSTKRATAGPRRSRCSASSSRSACRLAKHGQHAGRLARLPEARSSCLLVNASQGKPTLLVGTESCKQQDLLFWGTKPLPHFLSSNWTDGVKASAHIRLYSLEQSCSEIIMESRMKIRNVCVGGLPYNCMGAQQRI